MNDKILDTPFENEFQFKLKDDEEILWENEPNSRWSLFNFLRRKFPFIPFIFVGSGFLYMILIGIFKLNTSRSLFYGVIVSLLFLFFLFDYLYNRTTPKSKYLLTSQRMVFQKFEKGKSIILKIPLVEIETIDVQITSLSGNKGNVILGGDDLHSKENVDHFLENNSYIEREYKKILLLNIDNTPKVLKLIRQARLNAKGI